MAPTPTPPAVDWPAALQALATRLPVPPRAPLAAHPADWLHALLAHHHGCAYLRQYGSPATLDAFRRQVPLCSHDELRPWIERALQSSNADVLFPGRPVGCERTGGSTAGPKLIPYSAAGLRDFRHALLPWVATLAQGIGPQGRVYLATSPATRAPEHIGDLPVGLPDGAYLGAEAAAVLAARSAVPLAVGALTDVAAWRTQTVAHLRAAHDLALISVWSPTFLLALLDDIPDAAERWPQLARVSCWASASSARYAAELARRLPQARIEAKGLLATEGVVTVPAADGQPVLTRHGFFEFAQGEALWLAHELRAGESYEVILTTASGLYRYRLGDGVRCHGHTPAGDPVLHLEGRSALTSDLVGEKLTEAFVAHCLQGAPGLHGFAMLMADPHLPGYRLVTERPLPATTLTAMEAALHANPQYAHARHMQQLQPLQAWHRPDAWARVSHALLARGTRLADVKPLALRSEAFWAEVFRQP